MKVWFTRGLSNTADAVALIRDDPAARGIVVLTSHTIPDHPVGEVAHTFFVEPDAPTDADYADWVLERAIEHGVDLVVGQRRPDALHDARERFAAYGVRLQIAAEPAIRALLDDKDAFQADLRSADLPDASGHAALAFRTLPEFDAAWDALTADGEAASGLCAKPARGIFGAGFRLIEDGADDLGHIVSSDPDAPFRISLAAYRMALAGSADPPAQILMPFLPGVERSVDFVADGGTLLVAVARAKADRSQRLEIAGPSIEAARTLAARYRLDGLCNLQTREDDEGLERVLEINARMSGGMAMACLSGANLPLAAVMTGLGLDRSDMPGPRGGASVRSVSIARMMPPRAR